MECTIFKAHKRLEIVLFHMNCNAKVISMHIAMQCKYFRYMDRSCTAAGIHYTINMLRWITCIERRLDPLFDRDSSGGRRFVAPRPASKLFNSDGERAQINAWNDDTVNTPNLFNVFLVGLDTWVSKDCNGKKKKKVKNERRRKKYRWENLAKNGQ